MSDPQDLLYTNKFISTDIITDTQLVKETEYYDRFKNYIDNNLTDEIQNYVKNDEYETSTVNIDKSLDTKWPIYSNKNHYPLFDSYTNDISTNRYTKEVITKINIDSRYRDIATYSNSNNFSIQLDRVFNNVKKIVVNDIIITNIVQSITNINNNLSWQYASQNFLVEQNIDLTIIPVPLSKTISYSSLVNSVYQYETTSGEIANIDKYLVYQTRVSPGYYSIDDLKLNMRLATSNIVHGLNFENNIDIRIVEQPYLAYPKRIGTPHLFTSSIDPISSIVRFVNRIEEVRIAAIQTFSPYETEFQNTDIFYYFSLRYRLNEPPYILNTQYIYVILPAISDVTYQYYQNVNCIYTPNAFPLVITDLTFSPGNIDPELINFTEFYDIEIYLQNGYTEEQLKSVSYYKFIDILTFTNTVPRLGGGDGTMITSNYIRFALSLSTGNIHGDNYNSNGVIIRPSVTSNIVFSSGLNKILTSYNNVSSLSGLETDFTINGVTGTSNGTFVSDIPSIPSPGISSGTFNTSGTSGTTVNLYRNNIYTSGIITDYQYYDKECYIGRALLFRWIFDVKAASYIGYEFNTENEKKRSLLHILGWPIANESEQLYCIEQNNGFKFVHTNYQSQIINKNTLNTYNYTNNNNNPNYNLKLQYFSNKYFFSNNNYIYLKIYFDSHANLEDDTQYINTISAQSLLYNQVYINSSLFNVSIGQDYTCIKNNQNITTYKKDKSYIFTKILLSDVPGNTDIKISNVINNNSFYIYYDNIRDKIDYISVELYDSDMKLLFNDNNFSFTMNIHEIRDVLKETLINSKNNNVTTTGHFI
jgi:hypothetical protein